MKVNFYLPIPIRRFIESNKLSIIDIKKRVGIQLAADLLDENYKPRKVNEIKVIINGIQVKKDKVYLSPQKISKNKPLVKGGLSGERVSICYLIFKKK